MSYLKIITPINLAEEKERFLSSNSYSPQLKYNWDDSAVEEFKRISPRGAPMMDALIRQDGEMITREASKFFDVEFRYEDINFAKELISVVPLEANGTADECAALMKRKLAELGIDYEVAVVDEHGFQARPNHKQRTIKISKRSHLQFSSLESVVKHELVHIIRAVNGRYNGIAKSDDYLPTEEGLACLIQDELLVRPTASSFQHALEYLAANLSQTAGFRDIYDFLIKHGSDPENAWLRGIRQKFGMRDTSLPGGLVKSGMYFYHEKLTQQLSKDEVARLFVGKISQSQLSEHPTYVGKIPRETIERTLIAS